MFKLRNVISNYLYSHIVAFVCIYFFMHSINVIYQYKKLYKLRKVFFYIFFFQGKHNNIIYIYDFNLQFTFQTRFNKLNFLHP